MDGAGKKIDQRGSGKFSASAPSMIMKFPKGALLCLLGVALFATSSVVTKHAMQGTPFLMVALLWFSLASCWAFLGAFTRKLNPFPWLLQHWKIGLGIGGMNYLAALTWFYAIDKLGPSTTGFFQRLETLGLLLLGIALLHEKPTKGEIFGMAISLLGALLLTFSLERVLLLGVIIVILHAAVSAVHNYLGKVYVTGEDPYKVGTLRVFYTALLLLPTVLLAGQFQLPTPAEMPWLLVGTLLSPFLGWFITLASFRSLKASQAAIIINIHPFFVLLYAFLLFGTIPTAIQLIGGILIVAGILIPLIRKAQKAR